MKSGNSKMGRKMERWRVDKIPPDLSLHCYIVHRFESVLTEVCP
jgi:hypothetical protein